MKRNYYISLKGSTGEQQIIEPRQETIRRILEFSRTLKFIQTKNMLVEIRLN